MTFLQLRAAVAVERDLGDPLDDASPICFRDTVALDEREAFPQRAADFVNQWGLCEYFIPEAFDGAAASLDELLVLIRMIARRDLTLAIGHGSTLLGAICVWVGGDPTQKTRVAQTIRRFEPISLALTEREHGGDLGATGVRAEEDGDGYRLFGEKWLINNSTRSSTMTVLADTTKAGERPNQSVFLVEKSQLSPGSFTYLPKIRTHGIRGADISGIRFEGARVSKAALLGTRGAGLELVIRGLLITRTLCCSLSLGSADTALRTTLAFAQSRRIYGDVVTAIPYVRHQLASSFVDLLMCESVGLLAARSIHAAPEQIGIISAVAKYFVPTTAQALIETLAVVLGARHYVREEHQHGIFQKVLRDHALVGLFDGSTAVNLDLIATFLLPMAQLRDKASPADRAEAQRRIRTVATLKERLSPVDPTLVKILPTPKSDLLMSLAGLPARLALLDGDATTDPIVLAKIKDAVGVLVEELKRLDARAQGLPKRPRNKPAALIDLAKDFCELWAAAASVELWLANRRDLEGFFARGDWLALGLGRRVAYFRGRFEPDPQIEDRVVADLLAMNQANLAFSIFPIQLAKLPPS